MHKFTLNLAQCGNAYLVNGLARLLDIPTTPQAAAKLTRLGDTVAEKNAVWHKHRNKFIETHGEKSPSGFLIKEGTPELALLRAYEAELALEAVECSLAEQVTLPEGFMIPAREYAALESAGIIRPANVEELPKQ